MPDDGAQKDSQFDRLLEQLDSWRNLPSYGLENRIDALLAMYLREVLASHLGLDASNLSRVFPEFPLHKGTISSGYVGLCGKCEKTRAKSSSNQSIKVDFMMVDKQRKHAYLIEFKSDQASVSQAQVCDLDAAVAQDGGFKAIVQGVVTISGHTREIQKYVHLLHLMASEELVTGLEEVYGLAFPTVERGVGAALGQVQPSIGDDWKLEVVYISPEEPDVETKSDFHFVTFADLAKILGAKKSDPFALSLSGYFEKWAPKENRAGRLRPLKSRA